MSYREIYDKAVAATAAAKEASLALRHTTARPPPWATPAEPTPLSRAYKALWDAVAAEQTALTAHMRSLDGYDDNDAFTAHLDAQHATKSAMYTYGTELERARKAAFAAYEAAQRFEQTALEIYEHELMLLVLPATAPTEVVYKILGPRNKVPKETWMDAGLYGVSELGLRTDIRDTLQQECSKYLEAESKATREASHGSKDTAGFYFISAHTAHERIKAILAESPRVGLWKATKGASAAGGAGAGAGACAS